MYASAPSGSLYLLEPTAQDIESLLVGFIISWVITALAAAILIFGAIRAWKKSGYSLNTAVFRKCRTRDKQDEKASPGPVPSQV